MRVQLLEPPVSGGISQNRCRDLTEAGSPESQPCIANARPETDSKDLLRRVIISRRRDVADAGRGSPDENVRQHQYIYVLTKLMGFPGLSIVLGIWCRSSKSHGCQESQFSTID